MNIHKDHRYRWCCIRTCQTAIWRGWLTLVGASIGVVALGCIDTGLEEVEIPLYLAGISMAHQVQGPSDIEVVVEQAYLAFGPLYFCSGGEAGDLCDTAQLEWLDSAVVDLIDAKAYQVGTLKGGSGTVRSWMYDLGISSQLNRQEPYILPSAAQLGNISLSIRGQVELQGIWLPFTIGIPIQQYEDTERGVPLIRKSINEVFQHDVEKEEPGLLIRFDLRRWLASVDFREFVENRSCSIDGPEIVCEGTWEHRCVEGAAEPAQVRNCAEIGQVCLTEKGCADQFILETDTTAYRALHNAVVVGVRPQFEWGYLP